jgi:hypothetical protein
MAKLEEKLTHRDSEVVDSAPVLKSRLLALRAAPAQRMPYFWLTSASAGELVGVVIMEAPSVLQARMNAARAEYCRRRPLRRRSRAQRQTYGVGAADTGRPDAVRGGGG